MSPPIKEQQHWVCVVPVRADGSRLEFCLCRTASSQRWQFPESPIAAGQAHHEVAEVTARAAGVVGSLASTEPLERHARVRGGCAQQVSVFLHLAVDSSPDGEDRQQRWCLAEEARLRLRQKSMRRLVDVARHALDNGAAVGRGPADSASAADVPTARP